MPKDWLGHLAPKAALIAVVAALASTGSVLAQTPPPPSNAEVREALRQDSDAASEALNEEGLDSLRERGRFTIRVNPLLAGKFTARVKGKAFTAAYGERSVPSRGSYRITLRVTRDGRRYFKATRTAKLRLRLNFNPTVQPG